MPTTPSSGFGARMRSRAGSWWSAGRGRVTATYATALRAAVASALAYFLARHVLGHEVPFFASITAFILIGLSRDAKFRKVLELALGVAFGIVLGEAARLTIGPGTWQLAVVVFVAATLARLLDKSMVFAFQASIQGLLVLVMPVTPLMTPETRLIDAVTGVTVALIVHALTSGDPRRGQRRAADRFFTGLQDILASLAVAARSGDSAVARAGLREARATSQALTDEWTLANDAANDLASYAPQALRHAAEVRRIQHLLVGSDRAMRNLRVIARREVEFLESVPGTRYARLADALVAGQEAAAAVQAGIEHDVDFTEARRALRLFCSYLTPETLLRPDSGTPLGRSGHFEGVTLVVQLRSLAIDLLQATGLSASDAERFLPSLLIAADDDVIGPRPVTREMSAIEPPATTAALELLIADRSDPQRRGGPGTAGDTEPR